MFVVLVIVAVAVVVVGAAAAAAAAAVIVKGYCTRSWINFGMAKSLAPARACLIHERVQ